MAIINSKNNREKQLLVAKEMRMRAGYERLAFANFKKILKDTASDIAESYKSTNGNTAGFSTVFNENFKKTSDFLEKFHFSAGKKFAGDFLRDLNKLSSEVSRFDEIMLVFSKRLAFNRTMLISGTTEEMIFDIIDKGIVTQLTTLEIAEDIVKRAGGAIASQRAKIISITETHIIANQANLAVGLDTDIVEKKEWISTEDERTRPEHSQANGQIVNKNMPFIIGGEEMTSPGDPNASAKNVVNCRCTMGFVT